MIHRDHNTQPTTHNPPPTTPRPLGWPRCFPGLAVLGPTVARPAIQNGPRTPRDPGLAVLGPTLARPAIQNGPRTPRDLIVMDFGSISNGSWSDLVCNSEFTHMCLRRHPANLELNKHVHLVLPQICHNATKRGTSSSTCPWSFYRSSGVRAARWSKSLNRHTNKSANLTGSAC